MALSITDRILPEMGKFQFTTEAPIATKAMKFTAGRLTESIRILASLVEQVAIRTLYYTTFPTKWVAPSIHERLSDQLSASNKSLRNGLQNFSAPKQPAPSAKPIDKPLTLLQRLQGHLPKVSTRMALTGVAIGVIGISLYYFGPSLISKAMSSAKDSGDQPQLKNLLGNLDQETCPIRGPFDSVYQELQCDPILDGVSAGAQRAKEAVQDSHRGALTLFNPLRFKEATSAPEAPPTKVLLSDRILNAVFRGSQQLQPGQQASFDLQDGDTVCSGVAQNLGQVGLIQSSCEQKATKYTSYFQEHLFKTTPEETTFEVGPLVKFQPAKFQECLADSCRSIVEQCFNQVRNLTGKLSCERIQKQCIQTNSASCLQKVGEIVTKYSPFKCDFVNGNFENCDVIS